MGVMQQGHFQRFTLIVGVLFPFFSACEFSFMQPPPLTVLEEGLKSYNSGNYASAFKQFKFLAEEGDDEAQLYLAGMYNFGQSVIPTPFLAARWYKKSTAQGNIEAPYLLARMYELGPVKTRDLALAVTWYTKAAERGNTKAPYRLGLMYGLGRGVTQDFTKSYAWLHVAVLTGDEEAMKKRDGLIKKMTSAQIYMAYQLSEQIYTKNFALH